MMQIDARTAQSLGWHRLREEIRMCQDLIVYMDTRLSVYMTILGRMAVLKIKETITSLPKDTQKKVSEAWLRGVGNYGPWCVLKEAHKIHEGKRHNKWWVALELMMDPWFPWGVITLGGLMRAYSEVTEVIYGEMKNEGAKWDKLRAAWTTSKKKGKSPEIEKLRKGLKEWQIKAYGEEKGRVGWQNNLLTSMGGELFKKGQVSHHWKEDPKKAETIKKYRAMIKEKKERGFDSKDRLRYLRIFGDEQGEEVLEWDRKLDLLKAPWMLGAGRLRWQTFLPDRLSLIGDMFGLIRGATISGTTSDHAYSLWQLIYYARYVLAQDSEATSKIKKKITIGYKGSSGGRFSHTTDELKKAIKVIESDTGFGRIVQMMMLVPVAQMGVEMHHSVHEMASVLGLNDQIEWHVGYYDTLYTTLEAKDKMDRGRPEVYDKKREKTGMGKSALRQPMADMDPGKLKEVEGGVIKILNKYTDSVYHGYFVTTDTRLVAGEKPDGWGGAVVEKMKLKEKKDHRAKSKVSKAMFDQLKKHMSNKNNIEEIRTKGVAELFLAGMQSLPPFVCKPLPMEMERKLDFNKDIKKFEAAAKRVRHISEVIWRKYVKTGQSISTEVWECPNCKNLYHFKPMKCCDGAYRFNKVVG